MTNKEKFLTLVSPEKTQTLQRAKERVAKRGFMKTAAEILKASFSSEVVHDLRVAQGFTHAEVLRAIDSSRIDTYTKDEVLEIVRQLLFYGDPGFWEKGGINGVINFPPNGTYKKAKDYFDKYYLKTKNHE